MKHHAKASSGGSTQGRDSRPGFFLRGVLAARAAASLRADGSGAPSRARLSLLALAIAALALLALASSSFASKGVINWIGARAGTTGFGTKGGEFRVPGGIAVNSSGVGATSGDIYVTDRNSNRIEQFHADGSFVRAWGYNVIESGKPGDLGTNVFEVCTVAADCREGIESVSPARGGELSTPQGIAIDQSTGAVYVTEQGFRRVEKFSATGSFERAWGQDVVQTGKPEDNPPTAAKQTLTVDATGGKFTLTFKGQTTGEITYNAPPTGAGSVQEALQGLSTIGASNATVTEPSAGTYEITFAAALNNSSQPLIVGASSAGEPLSGGGASATVANTTTGSSGFEVCTTAANCKTGITGATAGAFASAFPGGIAVAPSGSPNAGNVFVADGANRRVQEFTLGGSFVRAFGFDVAVAPTGSGTAFEVCSAANFDVCKAGATAGAGNGQFANDSPTRVAVDDAGRIYAIDVGNSRVQRFTSAPAFDTLYGTTVLSGSPAPTNIAIDPGANAGAGDASDDHIFVLKACNSTLCPSGSLPPPFSTTESRIKEVGTAADPALVDTHLAGDGIAVTGSENDIAVNTATDRLFASSYGPFGNRLYMIDNPPPSPALVINSISTTDSTATFSATVDPMGAKVNCKFEYSTDQVNWIELNEPACEPLNVSGGAQAISQIATGLDPNKHYFVRLQASRFFPPLSTTTSAVRSFDTSSVPPVVTDVGAIQVADTSARMVATIDPRNSATGYVFHYGTTPALGSSTSPLAIGGGTTPITVTQLVGGLTPGTTYYYKLLATNAFGATSSNQKTLHTRTEPFPPANLGNCPNESVRAEQSSTFLPDCRAYEMVSPPDKNQGSAIGNTINFAAIDFARDGQGVAFCSNGALFGDPPAQQSFVCAPYLARRGPGGWTSDKPFPHYCPFGLDGNTEPFSAFLPRQSYNRAVLSVPEFPSSCPPIDPAAPQPALNLYREDLTTDPFSFDLLTPNNTITGERRLDGQFVGGSDDFSHVVYTSFSNQTPDSPTPEDHSFHKLYDWEEAGHGACAVPGGCLSLVSVDPSGNPFTTASKLPAYLVGVSDTPVASAVSADGNRIYFNNDMSPLGPTTFGVAPCERDTCALYMRENGDRHQSPVSAGQCTDPALACTFHVSASECTVDCGVDSSPARFLSADPAGDVAFFASCAKLTDQSSDPGACDDVSAIITGKDFKLYRWDRGGAPGHRLVDLTVDHEPGDGSQPQAIDLIGASEDGSAAPDDNAAPGNTVFFVAGGQIVSGAPTGPGLKLYRWRWNGGNPSVDYLAPYLSALPNGESRYEDPYYGLEGDPNANLRHVRVTPDGRYLLILTKLALDPASDRDSDADLYRWDEADGWICVSCQLPGAPSAGHADSAETFLSFNTIFHEYVSQEPEHSISDDGQRIFFETPDALVPEDVNGEASCPVVSKLLYTLSYSCEDVYEWHDGTLSLLTSGTGSKPFNLVGATHSGNDVFLFTAQHMVGRDADNGIDIYDTRVGGGFSEPPPQPPVCEGPEQCRGQGTVPPSTAGAGTAVFEGPPNEPKSLNCKAGFVRRHGHCAKKKRHHNRAHRRAANHNRRASR